jgi:hypothetical protein
MSETRLNWKTSLDLPYECDHIVDRALAGENAMVLMGCLMFLALSSGDAFALDLDDRFACALCLRGEKQPYPLLDNGDQWAFKMALELFGVAGPHPLRDDRRRRPGRSAVGGRHDRAAVDDVQPEGRDELPSLIRPFGRRDSLDDLASRVSASGSDLSRHRLRAARSATWR